MSRTLTASDRKALIRLASSLPVGSSERKAILAGLSKTAARFKFPRFPIRRKGDEVVVFAKTIKAGTEPWEYGYPSGRVNQLKQGDRGVVIGIIEGKKAPTPSAALHDQLGGGYFQDDPDQFLVNFGGMKLYVTSDQYSNDEIQRVPKPSEMKKSVMDAARRYLFEQVREMLEEDAKAKGAPILWYSDKQLVDMYDRQSGRGAWEELVYKTALSKLGLHDEQQRGRSNVIPFPKRAARVIIAALILEDEGLRMAASGPEGSGWEQYMHGVWKKEGGSHDTFWISSLDDISWLRKKVDYMVMRTPLLGGAFAPFEGALSDPKKWYPTAGGFAARV